LKVQRVIHKLWKEWNAMPKPLLKELPMKECIVGRYQYIYTEGKIRISLIKLNYTVGFGKGRLQDWEWEICGGGLQDIQRFLTKKDAVVHIKKLMKDYA